MSDSTIRARVASSGGAYVPAALLLEPSARAELRLYCLLRANSSNRTTYRNPEEIAAALGVSLATLYRWRGALKTLGWLRVYEVKTDAGTRVEWEVAGDGGPFSEVRTEGGSFSEVRGPVLTSESDRSHFCESHSISTPQPPHPTPKNKCEPGTDLFNEFWTLWPTKKARPKARTSWDKALAKTDAGTILAAVRQQLPELAANKARGFGLHATTWLNQERWEDEVEGVTEQTEVGAEWGVLADRLAPPWRVGRNDEAILAAVAVREGWTAEELENRLTYFTEFYEQLEWPLPTLAKVLTAPEGKLTDRYLEGLQADAKRPKRGRA